MTEPLILVFLKFPEPGRVKTRLAETIGPEAAAIVYQRLVRETLEVAHAANGEVRIVFDPPGREAEIADWIAGLWPGESHLLGFQPQASGDLGARLTDAFRKAFAEGREKVAVIGTDCTEISPATFDETWSLLDSGADAVFGPTEDGGYYLVGLSRLDDRLFDVPWSAPDTLAKSLQRAAECGFSTRQLPALTDIDTIDEWSARKARILGKTEPLDEPLIFQPIYQERVWGGRALEKIHGRKLPGDRPIGESWELVDRHEAQSVVRVGAFAGLTLNDLWRFRRREIFGDGAHGERFPLLMKVLDAARDLSVQVHPPADIAAVLGSEPKSEMWYVAAAEPGAKIFAGLKQGVTAEDLQSALNQGSAAGLLHDIEPKADQFISIPSGRLHAIGAGLLIYEIQENSDTTYRVFDWNRVGLDGKPRQLHLVEALASIDFDDAEPKLGEPVGDTLTRCDQFLVERLSIEAESSLAAAGAGRFAIITVVDGFVECGGHFFQPGDFFAIPASGGPNCDLLTHAQPATVLRTSLPQDPNPIEHQTFYLDLRQRLHAWAESKSGRNHRWIEYVLLAPDLFHLLCRLVVDPEVPAKQKLRLGVVIAYFISPIDLLPEGILGPIGYLDDIVLAAWIINDLINKIDPEIVRRHWAGEGDILAKTKELIAKADDLIGGGLWKRVQEYLESHKTEE